MRLIKIGLVWLGAIMFYYLTFLVIVIERLGLIPSSFPKNIEQLKLKKDWCIAQFKKVGLLANESVISSFKINQIQEDEIFRSDTAFITISYSLAGGVHEVKAIAKFSPSAGTIKNRVIFNLQQNQVKEINFYKALSTRIQVITPNLYFADYSVLTGNSCLIIEYIQNNKAFNEIEGCSLENLDSVVICLAQFHATFWGQKSNEVFGIASIPSFISDFFESTCWLRWSKATRKVFRKNWKHLNVNQTLIHGDSRIGNILFENHTTVKLIDWQAARISKGSYDLAYFLILSLPASLRLECEEELKLTYYEALSSRIKVEYSFEEFNDDYNHACIMVLSMLSIPWLSGEGSFEKDSLTLVYFVMGHHFWIKRLKSKISSFDCIWMANHFNISEEESKNVLNELVNVYEQEMNVLIEGSDFVKGRYEEEMKTVAHLD